jgi:hypothetical protein
VFRVRARRAAMGANRVPKSARSGVCSYTPRGRRNRSRFFCTNTNAERVRPLAATPTPPPAPTNAGRVRPLAATPTPPPAPTNAGRVRPLAATPTPPPASPPTAPPAARQTGQDPHGRGGGRLHQRTTRLLDDPAGQSPPRRALLSRRQHLESRRRCAAKESAHRGPPGREAPTGVFEHLRKSGRSYRTRYS